VKNLKTDIICHSKDQKYKFASVSYNGKEGSNTAGVFAKLDVSSALKALIY
jgi:hypothetical protein